MCGRPGENARPDCRWRLSAGAGMARFVTPLSEGRSLAGGCSRRWRGGRYRGRPTSGLLQPGAVTSRTGCPAMLTGRGRASAIIPDWPHPAIAALEPGRTSWTTLPAAVRLGLEDETAVTAAQVSEIVARLAAAGHWSADDSPMLVGSDVTRLA